MLPITGDFPGGIPSLEPLLVAFCGRSARQEAFFSAD